MTSYWGEPLCRPCARGLAEHFDKWGWPEVPPGWSFAGGSQKVGLGFNPAEETGLSNPESPAQNHSPRQARSLPAVESPVCGS